MKSVDKYLIIDDDATSTMLSSAMLKVALGNNTDVQCFNLPDKGVLYLTELCSSDTSSQIILFLDINMPVLSGWDVLDTIQEMDGRLRENLYIWMMSSSINAMDKVRALDHPLVVGFIEKPLTVEKVKSLAGIE